MRICARSDARVFLYSASVMPRYLAILLPFITASLFEVFTDGSHFARRETSPPFPNDLISESNCSLISASASSSSGVPKSTSRSSKRPYSATYFMFFRTASGSFSARHLSITRKTLRSPRPPLISRAKKRVFIAIFLSSVKARKKRSIISFSTARLIAPTVENKSRQSDNVDLFVTAPFSVSVLFDSFFK